MVIIEVTSTVHADKREAALEAMHVMGVETRKEPGCLHYRFYQDIDDPHTFFVYERWIDGAALDAHMKTPHMDEFRKIVPPAVVGKPIFARYDLENKEDK